MDEFLLRAAAAGVGIAAISGVLGCFLVWRRMAFFGDTLSHSALLGVAAGMFLNVGAPVAALALCLGVAALFARLERHATLASDTLLAVIAHGTLAAGVIAVSILAPRGAGLEAWLFGDLLAVGRAELQLGGFRGGSDSRVLLAHLARHRGGRGSRPHRRRGSGAGADAATALHRGTDRRGDERSGGTAGHRATDRAAGSSARTVAIARADGGAGCGARRPRGARRFVAVTRGRYANRAFRGGCGLRAVCLLPRRRCAAAALGNYFQLRVGSAKPRARPSTSPPRTAASRNQQTGPAGRSMPDWSRGRWYSCHRVAHSCERAY